MEGPIRQRLGRLRSFGMPLAGMSGMHISCSIHGSCIFVFLLAGQTCLGQSVSIGVKAGGRLTDDMSSIGSATSESKRYIVGPMVEFGLPAGRQLGRLLEDLTEKVMSEPALNDRAILLDMARQMIFERHLIENPLP